MGELIKEAMNQWNTRAGLYPGLSVHERHLSSIGTLISDLERYWRYTEVYCGGPMLVTTTGGFLDWSRLLRLEGRSLCYLKVPISQCCCMK